jgi:hypothetical protein
MMEIIMENYIYTSHRTYIVDVIECDDGKYKLEIHDDNGTYHYPKYFIDCDVEGITAINLTWDDVQEFFTAIKEHDAN